MDKLKKKGARSLGGAKKKEYFCNYLGLLPFFILFGVFMLYPFLYGVVMVRQQRKRGDRFCGAVELPVCVIRRRRLI